MGRAPGLCSPRPAKSFDPTPASTSAPGLVMGLVPEPEAVPEASLLGVFLLSGDRPGLFLSFGGSSARDTGAGGSFLSRSYGLKVGFSAGAAVEAAEAAGGAAAVGEDEASFFSSRFFSAVMRGLVVVVSAPIWEQVRCSIARGEDLTSICGNKENRTSVTVG